jgi:hypothetical protein
MVEKIKKIKEWLSLKLNFEKDLQSASELLADL